MIVSFNWLGTNCTEAEKAKIQDDLKYELSALLRSHQDLPSHLHMKRTPNGPHSVKGEGRSIDGKPLVGTVSYLDGDQDPLVRYLETQ